MSAPKVLRATTLVDFAEQMLTMDDDDVVLVPGESARTLATRILAVRDDAEELRSLIRQLRALEQHKEEKNEGA